MGLLAEVRRSGCVPGPRRSSRREVVPRSEAIKAAERRSGESRGASPIRHRSTGGDGPPCHVAHGPHGEKWRLKGTGNQRTIKRPTPESRWQAVTRQGVEARWTTIQGRNQVRNQVGRQIRVFL